MFSPERPFTYGLEPGRYAEGFGALDAIAPSHLRDAPSAENLHMYHNRSGYPAPTYTSNSARYESVRGEPFGPDLAPRYASTYTRPSSYSYPIHSTYVSASEPYTALGKPHAAGNAYNATSADYLHPRSSNALGGYIEEGYPYAMTSPYRADGHLASSMLQPHSRVPKATSWHADTGKSFDENSIENQYNVDRKIFKYEDLVEKRTFPSFEAPATATAQSDDDDLAVLGLGYKSPYTGKVFKAPMIPNARNTNPTAHLAHASTFWKENGTGHPISSKKRDKRLNTILAMLEELQLQGMRRGVGSSAMGSLSSFFHSLLSPAYPASGNPPMLPPGPVKDWTPITGKRKALLIGINYTGQKGQLRGCANDVKEMEQYLRRRGYNDIQKFVDDGTNETLPPTKANILAATTWLVKDAGPGDSLFFHYSGHGGQQKDASGDEADGKDETIVPMDFSAAGMITDDTLSERLCLPLPNGCRLTALMDCCHSGTGFDLPYIKSSSGGAGLQCEYKDSRLRGEIILFSGCKDEQTSADVLKGDIGYGAMTNSFLSAAKENSNQSYSELLHAMRDRLLQDNYSQVPQVSMSRNMNLDALFTV